MTKALLLQPARVPLGTDKNGDPVTITREWFRVLENLASAAVQATDSAAVDALAAEVAVMSIELATLGANDIVAPVQAANDGLAFEMTMAPVNFFPAASVTLPSFADGETPTGTIDGTNVTFTVAQAPNPGVSLGLFLNGIRLDSGFTLTGATITYTVAPASGDTHRASYRY